MGSTRPQVGAAQFLLAAVAVLLVGCGSSGGGTDQSSSSSSGGAQDATAVTIRDYTYKPAKITVPAGTELSFTNEDSTAHTATSTESGVFESGSIKPGKSGSIALDQTGTFTYYCLFHPFMKGTVVVE